jgi:predicted ATPase
MKIRDIQLRDFKRFTHTAITDIPVAARLIILAGPNGSGKSSLIDAVHTWHGHMHTGRTGWDDTYHAKQTDNPKSGWGNRVEVSFHAPEPNTPTAREKAIYVRTAYRNDPEFQLSSLSHTTPATKEHRIHRLIENDTAVSRNYQRLVAQAFEDAFERGDPEMTLSTFREQTLGEIRDAMQRLFPGLILNSLGNPLTHGTFKFDKGDSKSFLYKNLSGGEKSAFDLLLDILIKRREFDDTVFFIDEPEAHIGSALQSALLHELFQAVPAQSQLWLATHSIGMMRKAREIGIAHPGSVVFIDFDGVNFDLPQVLKPVQADRPFWKRAMQIALDDLAGYVAPDEVILCEGGLHSDNAKFDAECYNEIFKTEYALALFLGAGNAADIQNDPRGVQRLVSAMAPGVRLRRVIDQDDRTLAEIKTLRNRGVRVLTRRHIESYLLDDDVLTRLCAVLGDVALAPRLLAAKAAALQVSTSAGGQVDDLKRVAGDVFVAAKQLFNGQKLGSDKRAFMRGFCAPLIQPGTSVYDQLKKDIFGQ